MVAPRSDLHNCVLASHNGSYQWHNLDLASYDKMQLAISVESTADQSYSRISWNVSGQSGSGGQVGWVGYHGYLLTHTNKP